MKRRKEPERTCIGCRSVRPKRQLVRVVRTPEGEVTVDFTGKRSGRGAYVCPDETCLNAAVTGKRLERALQHPVPEEVRQNLVRVLEQPR